MESNLTIYVKTGNVEITNQKLNTLQLNSDPAQFVKEFISEHNTSESAHTYIQGRITLNSEIISAHMADSNNPHVVTKAQVGLGNVDNTSDLDKPISTATQTALDGKQATISDLATIRSDASAGKSASDTLATYGDIVTHNASEFATAAQGSKADTAVQPAELATVATTGSYTDLLNKPTIPTVNDATLTIQKNGTDIATFTANSSTNATANIAVPTQASDIGAQEALVSGTNIKTVNGNSLLGSGNVDIDALPSQTGQSGKFLTTDGTDASWANVDALPSQTGQNGKFLTTDGSSASWEIPMAGLPMFYATYQPRKLNNASWLRADSYSWHSADMYVSAYAHLADNISGVTAQTETIAGTTITYYRLSDEIKVVLPDQQANLDTIYNATGIGYYFVLDTTNRQFKLPRNIYGFTGYRGDVGGYVAESLPNITGSVANSVEGTISGAFNNGSTIFGTQGGSQHNFAQGTFDASRVSSTYQNGAPVQERATQAYLYFYVGNTVQNETSVDVTEMTEAINDKADISAVKTLIVPNYLNAVVLLDGTVNTSGTYTVPYPGLFEFDFAGGTVEVSVYINNILVAIKQSTTGVYGFHTALPAKTGDVVTYNNMQKIRFFPYN